MRGSIPVRVTNKKSSHIRGAASPVDIPVRLPRALKNSPPGCSLPRLRLGRAVRFPYGSQNKKAHTSGCCVPGRHSRTVTPRAKQSPTGALFTAHCAAALFDSRTGHKIKKLTHSGYCVPGRHSRTVTPRAKQSPTGALFTAHCAAALFDSRTGHKIKKLTFLDAASPVDIPVRLPRALKNSPPGCSLPRLRLGRAVRFPYGSQNKKAHTFGMLRPR